MNNMVIVTFENGSLMSSRADDFFRYHDQERTEVENDGHVEAPTGHFTLRVVTRSVIADYVSEHGDPWASMQSNLPTGWYIDVRNEDGSIWAFYYGDEDYTLPEEAARKDFNEARRLYTDWISDIDDA